MNLKVHMLSEKNKAPKKVDFELFNLHKVLENASDSVVIYQWLFCMRGAEVRTELQRGKGNF